MSLLIQTRDGSYDDNKAVERLEKNPDSFQNAVLPWTPPVHKAETDKGKKRRRERQQLRVQVTDFGDR
jgi:hypothetical protein